LIKRSGAVGCAVYRTNELIQPQKLGRECLSWDTALAC